MSFSMIPSKTRVILVIFLTESTIQNHLILQDVELNDIHRNQSLLKSGSVPYW